MLVRIASDDGFAKKWVRLLSVRRCSRNKADTFKEDGETLIYMHHDSGKCLMPEEEELLNGMCNCYEACGEDFEETVRMVARARKLSPEFVIERLREMAKSYSNDLAYRSLRARLPREFPF
jgi:hypothetical protein